MYIMLFLCQTLLHADLHQLAHNTLLMLLKNTAAPKGYYQLQKEYFLATLFQKDHSTTQHENKY